MTEHERILIEHIWAMQGLMLSQLVLFKAYAPVVVSEPAASAIHMQIDAVNRSIASLMERARHHDGL